MNVREYYDHALTERSFRSDDAQRNAVERLQRAYEEWIAFKAQRLSKLKRLISRPTVLSGEKTFAFDVTIHFVRSSKGHN